MNNNNIKRKITLEEHYNNVELLAWKNFELMRDNNSVRKGYNTFKHIACGRLFSIHNSKLIKSFKENKEVSCPHCIEK